MVPAAGLVDVSRAVHAHLPPRCLDIILHAQHATAHVTCDEQVPRHELPQRLANLAADPEYYQILQVCGRQLIRLPPAIALGAQDPSDSLKLSAPAIGNLLLSSCPGKKVRLDGPIQGRIGICRDLKRDLERFRDMGVRAMVCCLDDEELDMLGSPGAMYLEGVEAAGFDLIRLPIAEGFAPTDMIRFDIMMTSLILNYTLRGSSILVHCRGGVGRAGLLGCAWLLKMGLVGACSPETLDDSSQALQLVLRVIDVVRHRRSPRAVETAEQVHFLLEYVRYMQRQEYARRCLAQSHRS